MQLFGLLLMDQIQVRKKLYKREFLFSTASFSASPEWCHTIGCSEDALLQFIMVAGEKCQLNTLFSGSVAAALHAGIPQIICPFVLDQFYWAEKMSWLGVAPQPLKRNHLVLEKTSEENIMEAAQVVAKAIFDALSAKTKTRAVEIADILSLEDGVSEAVRVLREEVCEVCSSK